MQRPWPSLPRPRESVVNLRYAPWRAERTAAKNKQRVTVMKKVFLSAIIVVISLSLAGCGSDDHGVPLYTTQILSDPASDGDIARDPDTGFFLRTQGMTSSVQSVFAGINPATFVEYRAFLDFPLTGAGGVPGDAVIVSATLDIFIDNIFLDFSTDTIPIRIDLVSFPPFSLVQEDFGSTALATTTISPPISSADFGKHVFVDVTSLMREAQRLGLPDFQVRILEDLVAFPPGLIEINDTTGSNRGVLAPLLEVTYY